MKKQVLLFSLLLLFAFSPSWARESLKTDSAQAARLKDTITQKAYQVLHANKSKESLSKTLEQDIVDTLKQEYPQAEGIFNAGQIYYQYVQNASLPNETTAGYLFAVKEEKQVTYYMVSTYLRQSWSKPVLSDFNLLSRVDAAQALPLDILTAKIKLLKYELEELSADSNLLKVMFSAADINEIKSVLKVHKGETFVEEEQNRPAYEGQVEILLMNGEHRTVHFTCVPAGATEDKELTFEKDEFQLKA